MSRRKKVRTDSTPWSPKSQLGESTEKALSTLESASTVGSYNPMERMREKETLGQKIGELPIMLIRLGATAGGLVGKFGAGGTLLKQTGRRLIGRRAKTAAKRIAEKEFIGKELTGEAMDRVIGEGVEVEGGGYYDTIGEMKNMMLGYLRKSDLYQSWLGR